MARYKVILAYDGSEFLGFQRQGRGRTVQHEVEAALRKIGWVERSILAAGRTDRGVHAAGQVIAFDLPWKHSLASLQEALNAYLPPDIAAREVAVAGDSFHPRFDALLRRYRYSLFCDPVRQPLLERYAWRVWPPVAVAQMSQAASLLTGTFDFAAFGSPMHDGGSTLRTVFEAKWLEIPPGLAFEVSCDAFLYHMVRRMVALLVEIGQGNLEPNEVMRYLLGQASPAVLGLAPAQGLTLYEVEYPAGEDEQAGT